VARDLDALEDVVAGQPLPALKVQATGPWTLATLIHVPRGDRVLADHGAVADLAASLAEGLSRQLADLARRFPGTELVLQLDEPSLPAVLAGGIPTSSGWGRLRVPDRQVVVERLCTVLAAGSRTVVHCCAPRAPVDLLARTGVGALSLDAGLLTPYDDDAIGAAVEGGTALLLGLVPSTDSSLADLTARMEPARVLWRRLGFAHDRLPGTVVVTPTCGLAGASPGYARAALRACAELGRRLGEEPE
jgi:methionine synthase II (cobalamin-independent)